MLRALDVFPQSADLNSIYGDVQFFLRHDTRTAYKHYALALESDRVCVCVCVCVCVQVFV